MQEGLSVSMKNKKTNLFLHIYRHYRFVMLIAVSMIMLLVVGVAHAYFTANDSVKNVLKSQNLTFAFEVDEVFTSPENVRPGQTVQKVVNVKNVGDEVGFVRLLVFVEIVASDGTVLEAIPGTTFTFDDLNTTDWTPGNTRLWANGADGYYYYLDKLDPAMTTTQPLFSSVTLAAGLSPEYENASMKIEVKVEASEISRSKYRDGWWKNGDNVPSSQALARIDEVLRAMAKTP
jgi:predicted ribosomally synthesized peptide with SipW-like signal peptide